MRLFKDKNRYVYEIAVFNNGMNNDPTYFMLDTKYCVLYEVDTLIPIVESKEMLKELDTIEKEYMKTQKKNMTQTPRRIKRQAGKMLSIHIMMCTENTNTVK